MLSQMTIIPAKDEVKKQFKTDAYCEVSTKHEEQTRSLRLQAQYYTKIFDKNP